MSGYGARHVRCEWQGRKSAPNPTYGLRARLRNAADHLNDYDYDNDNDNDNDRHN